MNVLPHTDSTMGFRVRRHAVRARAGWVALAWAPLATSLLLRFKRQRARGTELVDVAGSRFCGDYLEHLIRLASFTAASNPSVVRRATVQRPAGLLWRSLSTACASIGYTWGVFNVAKYWSRTTGDFTGPRGAMTAAEVMGDRLGMCLAYRDAALDLIGRPRPTDAEIVEARRLMNKALEYAAAVETPSIMLKVLIAARRLDPGRRVPVGEVDRLLGSAECEAMTRQAAEIRKILCD